MTSRIGIDIGGTFTDATVINEATGEIFIDKVTSTPRDPSIGFLQATNRILERNELDPKSTAYLVHGTTVATNAIIENTLVRFRDMLEIERQHCPRNRGALVSQNTNSAVPAVEVSQTRGHTIRGDFAVQSQAYP